VLFSYAMSPSARPPAPEIGVGSTLDRYEIVRAVARGGMGSVWLARFGGKHGFTKQVAIKTILPELAQNPQFNAMFLEEARISSKLAHANVAQVLDVGEHSGTIYIVFEWVEGKSLEQLCRAAEATGERIPLPLLLRVLADACAGLHAAHELTGDDHASLRIVHRDVTPGNILVSEKGFAKVIDFGIAKARDRVSGETRSGFVKGTPQYMSPEAACRMPLDRRADVWSLGATLFRALSGAPPFTDLQKLLDYMDGVTKLPALPDDVPPDVQAIVARAMQVDRAKRFATTEEMRFALERTLHSSPVSSDEISAAASRLTSSATSLPFGGADAHAETELALPSMPVSPPATARAVPRHADGTLVSAKAPREPKSGTTSASARDPRDARDSLRAMTYVVIGAGIVTIAAAALVFCG
jgi:serine/threonine-protein kinase